MNHSAGRTQDEEGDENPKRASSAQEETYDGETEERPPPNSRVRLTRAAAKGGKREGRPPPAARAHGKQQGDGGDP